MAYIYSLLTKETAILHHLNFFTLIHLPVILKMIVTRLTKKRKQENTSLVHSSSLPISPPTFVYPYLLPSTYETRMKTDLSSMGCLILDLVFHKNYRNESVIQMK